MSDMLTGNSRIHIEEMTFPLNPTDWIEDVEGAHVEFVSRS